jgi:hypothetical protein
MKLVLQYGCEALVTAGPTILNKLEMIKNQAVRLITGAVISTTLTSMQALTVNNLLKFEKEKVALILYGQLTHLSYNNCWSIYKY